jgi:hypothetical protein
MNSKIGQPVEIGDRQGVDAARSFAICDRLSAVHADRTPCGALGAAHHRTRHMQLRCAGAPPGKMKDFKFGSGSPN